MVGIMFWVSFIFFYILLIELSSFQRIEKLRFMFVGFFKWEKKQMQTLWPLIIVTVCLYNGA